MGEESQTPLITHKEETGNKENALGEKRTNGKSKNRHDDGAKDRYMSVLTQMFNYRRESDDFGVILSLPDKRFRYRFHK